MAYDRTALKRAVNVSLNEDLVRQARRFTRNLSGTLEDLLAAFVDQEDRRRRDDDARLGRLVDRVNRFHAEAGFLSDEFSTF